MPTRRGWLLLVGAAGLGLGGRLLGLAELLGLAAASFALVVGGLVYVGLTRVPIDARRSLVPARLPAGGGTEVEVVVHNGSRRRTAVLELHDRFLLGPGSPRFELAPLASGQAVRTTYRLTGMRRGVHLVGPLLARRRDPFGVAAWANVVLDPTALTVFPHVDTVTAPPCPLVDQFSHDPLRRAVVVPGGEEFFSLRPYVEGDDLRLVHWASTARLDDLVVRQDEALGRRRTTIVADLRSAVHDGTSFESNLSGVASVVSACARERITVRLVTTGGLDTGDRGGQSSVEEEEEVIVELADVEPHPGGPLGDLVRSACSLGGGASAVAFTTGGASAGDLTTLAELGEVFASVTLVRFEQAGSSVPPAPAGFDAVVGVTSERPFPIAWEHELAFHRGRT